MHTGIRGKYRGKKGGNDIKEDNERERHDQVGLDLETECRGLKVGGIFCRMDGK